LISEAVVSNVKAGSFKTKTSSSFLSVTIVWPLHKGIPTMVVWKFIWPLLFADLLGISHPMYGNSLPLDAHYSTITLWHIAQSGLHLQFSRQKGRPYLSTFGEFSGFSKQTCYFFHHW
jgi:hypothetical protein